MDLFLIGYLKTLCLLSVNIVKKGLQYSNQNVSLQFSINQLILSPNVTLLILVLDLCLKLFDRLGFVLNLPFCNAFCFGTRL